MSGLLLIEGHPLAFAGLGFGVPSCGASVGGFGLVRCRGSTSPLSKHFGMRTEADQAENIFRLGVDQHQVGLDVAIAMIAPVAGERMILITGRKRFIQCQNLNNSAQISLHRPTMATLQFSLEIAPELAGLLNLPH